MSICICQVSEVSQVAPSIIKLVLSTPAELGFKAGQYIQVVMGEGDKRPFSIATGPSTVDYIELHIGADANNSYAGEVIEKAKAEGELVIEGPLGEAFLQEKSVLPNIIVAGGTGYSYARSLLQQWACLDKQTQTTLYWGTRHMDDMYEFKNMTQLAQTMPLFQFVPVIQNPTESWQGRSGWVHEAVLADHQDLSGFNVYVAGRFEMAKVIKDSFIPAGLLPANLIGDAFAFI